tara:strand:- start:619 stop:810 length:192 start_codon:yes stop_codon:yes gene_type:complete
MEDVLDEALEKVSVQQLSENHSQSLKHQRGNRYVTNQTMDLERVLKIGITILMMHRRSRAVKK